jgi:hypothetical protein
MKLDDATARRLAVAASCDPRTIKRAARGERVRGLAGQRARAALRDAGFVVADPNLPAGSRVAP